MMLRTDACVSEEKSKVMCGSCVRNIDMVDVVEGQTYGEFEITKVKNFRTGATTKCSGFLDKKS